MPRSPAIHVCLIKPGQYLYRFIINNGEVLGVVDRECILVLESVQGAYFYLVSVGSGSGEGGG